LRYSSTIAQLLAAGREAAAAIAAPSRRAMTHGELRFHVDATVDALNARGIGRNDRVAIVLPNGPELASAFVAIGAGATTAPLNPAYRREEFDSYLSALRVDALVVEQDSASPAVAAAEALGIPVFELGVAADAAAGAFTLHDAGAGRGERTPGATLPAAESRAEPAGAVADGAATEIPLVLAASSDIALLLHTSGTTARPKIVPLTHGNLGASARNVAFTLQLTAEDRCLNVMPLFHIHGLVAAVLAPLATGGSVFCTPGFDAVKFFGWLEDAQPTWCTAVPTMYQAVLMHAERNRQIIERSRLRLLRSASASLPPPVMTQVEEVFGVPLLEAYAMTEAAHQVTCNPLPPEPRKPGSVGPAAGPEVAVMDGAGNRLGAGEVGEVVVRGANVMEGYENAPEANAAAFTSGWFRTGDEGRIDGDGYLTLTGRLEEVINRGGEKVSP
jgi:acyl-CoA synthetase (AMP-forming)/AMP-acid ligase II